MELSTRFVDVDRIGQHAALGWRLVAADDLISVHPSSTEFARWSMTSGKEYSVPR
jgi:hypothetical protein